jgi:hypothetical protein
MKVQDAGTRLNTDTLVPQSLSMLGIEVMRSMLLRHGMFLSWIGCRGVHAGPKPVD